MSSPLHLGRARARIRQRGTALMEALIVNMSLVTLLAGVAYFGALYTAKIKSDQYSRAYAFTFALHGCQSGDEAVSNESLGIGASDEVGSDIDPSTSPKKDLDDSGHAVPDTGNSNLDNSKGYTDVFSTSSLGSVNAKSTMPVGGYGPLGIGAGQVSSTTRVLCNSAIPKDSDLIQAGVDLAKSFASW